MFGWEAGEFAILFCGILLGYAIGQPRKFSGFVRSFIGGLRNTASGMREQNRKYNRSGGDRQDDRYDDRHSDRYRDDRDDDRRDRGRRPRTRIETCSVCKGRGWIKPPGMDFSGQARRDCKQCEGTGEEVIEY